MSSIIKYTDGPQHTVTAKQHFNIPKYHLKHWDNLENLKSAGKQAMCTDPIKYPNSPIAGKNGTYNKPAPIYLGFGNFNLPRGTVIEKAIVHYAHCIYAITSNPQSKDYPSFNGPTISFYNESTEAGASTLPKFIGKAPTSTYTHYTQEVTGLKTEHVMSAGFGLIISYPKNMSTSQGRLGLGDVYLELITRSANVIVNLKASSDKISKGNTVNITCSVLQKDNTSYNPRLRLSLSSGLEFVNKITGTGTIDTKDGIIWTTILDKAKKSECVIQVRGKTEGAQTITITDIDTGTQYTLKLGVTATEVTVYSNILKVTGNKNIKVNETVTYYIYASTNNPQIKEMPLEIHLPACAEIENIQELQEKWGTKSGTVTKVNNITVTKGNTATIPVTVKTENKEKATGDVTLSISDKKYSILQATDKEKILSITTQRVNNIGDMTPIKLQVTFNDSGIFEQLIKYKGNTVNTTTITVRPRTYTTLAFTRVKLPEKVLQAMGHKIKYTAVSRIRYTADTKQNYTIDDHKRNLRFGIFQGDPRFLEDTDTFLDNIQFASKIETNQFLNYTIEFIRYQGYPIYLVWTQEYLQSQNFEIIDVEFMQPLLLESSYYNQVGIQSPAIYPDPVSSLLQNISWAKVTIPAKTKTNSVVMWSWNSGNQASSENLKDMVIQGLRVSWDYIVEKYPVELQIYVYVNIPDGNGNIITKNGYRNITLNPASTEQHNAIGGEWDSYDLKASELKDIESMSVLIVLNNTNNSQAVVSLQNFFVEIHSIEKISQPYSFSINGERASDYGIFLADNLEWDFGTKNAVKYYNTSGTDTHTAYRMNIDTKELSFKFNLGTCDLEEATHLLDKVATLFTNERTLYNKPIEKELVFDHMPEYSFMFIRENPFDTKLEHGQYTCTVKLTIPSGTRRKRAKTVTGSHGSNTGIAKVQPIIKIIATTKDTITITEEQTRQTLVIDTTKSKDTNYKIETGDTLSIDSENRSVWLYKSKTSGTGRLITKYVDYSSTWFSVKGAFNFKSNDCNINSVSFYERGG
jgi:hypothetical protein